MFLTRLKRPQQMAFLSLARELVASNSVAAMGEVAAMARVQREMGLDQDGPVEWLAVAAAAARFESTSDRTVVMLELLTLGYADGNLTMLEHALVRRLALVWRIDAARLAKLEDWVRRHRRLMDEGVKLIGNG